MGKITYVKGGYFKGLFEKGMKNGEGFMIYANQDRYSGQWRNDLKEGFGTYLRFDNQMRLKGEWSQGQLAKGEWILQNNISYNGNFHDSYPNGQGTWNFPNNQKLEGNWYVTQKQNLKQIPKEITNNLYE